MRHALREATPEDLRWLSHYADCALTPAAKGLTAVDTKGRQRGVVAFDEFHDGEAKAHQALAHAAGRALLSACFRLAFEVLGLERLVGVVHSSNAKALRLNARLGFREVSRDAEWVRFEMTRGECRWLRKAGE